MSVAAELTRQLIECLRDVTAAGGYQTNFKGVYEAGEVKPDKAPVPALIVAVAEDLADGQVGPVTKRLITYQIEGVFSRATGLPALQTAYAEALKGLGYGQQHRDRALKAGAVVDESVEYDMAVAGGPHRRFISSITVRYVERY